MGDVIKVRVISLMPFGAFAEIVDGVDGLIHISQLALTRVARPQDVLNIGDIVDVKIVGIDEEKKNVSLSIRALLEEAAKKEPADNNEVAKEVPAEAAEVTAETTAQPTEGN